MNAPERLKPTPVPRDGLRPPLKWAGGKRWLVPHLAPLWQTYLALQPGGRLVEPFCGGLAVTLGLNPPRALLNDVNPHPVSFYRWLQEGLVVRRAMENDADHYYAAREEFNGLLAAGKGDSREAAELFYYLNRTGYNGLCRFNKRGGFNVPFGRYAKINYTRDFTAYAAAFADWHFSARDFAELALEDDDFVYADPPYDVQFTAYAAGGFGWDDQVRLAEWLARHPGPVVLSNQATPRIVDLYRELGFELQYLDAPRMISCTGDRTPAREVLALRGIAQPTGDTPGRTP
jgi:DNA adenine methylase